MLKLQNFYYLRFHKYTTININFLIRDSIAEKWEPIEISTKLQIYLPQDILLENLLGKLSEQF